MTDAARVLLDTNILVAATDETRSGHVRAGELLTDEERELIVTTQVVREYLVMATRPQSANGLGLSGETAVANLDDLLYGVEVFPDSGAAVSVLMGFVHRGTATGKQVHDANLVAQALHHHADVIVTDNRRHFARFDEFITIESLLDED